MSSYILVDPKIEEAIMEDDLFDIRDELPNLTGMEVDANGFPLLYLAAKEDAQGVFAELLKSGQFSPETQGLCAVDAAQRAEMERIGCKPDDRLEEQWGIIDGKRVSLLEKLLTELPETMPETSALQYRSELLLILLQEANTHWAFDLDDETIGHLRNENLLHEAIACKSSRLCASHDVVPGLLTLIDEIDEDTRPDIVEKILAQCRTVLTKSEYQQLVETFLGNEIVDSAIIKVLLKHIDIAAISDEAQHHLLLKALEPGWEMQDRRKHRSADDIDGGYDTELLDMIWPYLDVNKLQAMPHESRENSPHLLVGAVSGFGKSVTAYDEDFTGEENDYLFNKIITDPRLDLPAQLLADAYMAGIENAIIRTSDHDSVLLLQYEAPDPKQIVALKNFDPNARIKGEPLVMALFKRFTGSGNEDTVKGVDDLAMGAPYKAIGCLIDHADFDPYEPCANGEDLAETIRAYKQRKGRSNQKTFIDMIAEAIEKTKLNPGKAIMGRLEEAFAHKLAPEQWLDAEGKPVKAITIAATAGVLPDFLKAGTWADNLDEVVAYESALNKLPQDFRERYEPQLHACRVELAEARVRFNRPAEQDVPKGTLLEFARGGKRASAGEKRS